MKINVEPKKRIAAMGLAALMATTAAATTPQVVNSLTHSTTETIAVQLQYAANQKTGQVSLSNPGNYLIVRSGPGTNYGKVCRVQHGVMLNVHEETGSGWLRVSVSGNGTTYHGYCAAQYVKITSQTSASSTWNGYVKTSNPGNRLNLRSQASTSSKVLDKLSYGTPVAVLSSSGSWYYVEANGTKGYVSKDYISASNPNGASAAASTSSGKTLTNALYGINSGSSRISCGFDGYRNTKGKHEGIDFTRQLNAPVYSLTDGVITKVSYGKVGSSGLSTIAVYNSAQNVTVVYLHTKPVSGLYAGKTVRVGEQLATESWRGVNSQSGSHTHVEIRPGRHTSAAKSVNDYRLENPNPSGYWNAFGYKVF